MRKDKSDVPLSVRKASRCASTGGLSLISVISILSALTEFPVKGSQLSHRCGAAGAPRAVVIVIIVIIVPIVIVVIVVVAVVIGRAAVIKDVVIAALADIDGKADVLTREFSFRK